jgi:hypothetical protein
LDGPQAPKPLQVNAENVVPVGSQVPGWHESPAAYFWQAPLPSHEPLSLQVVTPLSWQRLFGSGFPAFTGEQVPSKPSTAQDVHKSWQALPQHTPCSQKFEMHSEGAAQFWPLLFLPHDPFVHWPDGAHSAPPIVQPV